MPNRGHAHFSLHLGPYTDDTLLVRRIDGVEQLSTPFAVTVTFSTVNGEPIDLHRLIAREARLAIRRPDSAYRWVHGICAKGENVGNFAGQPLYRVTISPKLQLLAAKTNSRVFQSQTAIDIVASLLQKAGIVFRQKLRGTYPVREMCIQYRETDLAFVSRLLEEEGITYWFEQEERQHTLVLGDTPDSFGPLAGEDSLPYRTDIGAVANEEYLFDLHRQTATRPSRSTLRDFDFEHPSLDVSASTPPRRGGEVYDYPSGNVQPAETKRLGQVRLEELQAGAETWSGQGSCERFAPGFAFAVSGHPRADFDVRLLATRVTHRGMQQTSTGDAHRIEASYRNEFQAIRANRQYRPPRGSSRPTIRGVQTATVVGPPGEEVHPDKFGRIKVQFHWDRKGNLDDRASAWVRLAQSWSGPGFGALFVPRVGQEVVLRFLEGNPDRPIITGAVYNGQHPPPIDLPNDKTKSTLKTDSSPHSGGSNELRFEDAAGQEQIYVHGQKDEQIEARNDKSQVVHRNERLRVDQDRSRSVGGDQTLRVSKNDASRIQGNQSLTVHGDRSTWVGGSHSETVSGSHEGSVFGSRHLTVQLASTEVVGAAAALTVGGIYAVSVGGALNEAVGGMKSCEVAGAKIEVVGAQRMETVAGDSLATVGGDFSSVLAGQLDMTVGKDMNEDTRITEIQAHAPVSWSAKDIHITADDFELIVGGRVAISMKDGTVQIFGRTISVSGATVSARGATLAKIGPGTAPQKRAAARQLAALRSAPASVSIKLVTSDGRPVANERVSVLLPNGTSRSVVTDAQGQCRIPSPRSGPCKVSLPRLPPTTWRKQ